MYKIPNSKVGELVLDNIIDQTPFPPRLMNCKQGPNIHRAHAKTQRKQSQWSCLFSFRNSQYSINVCTHAAPNLDSIASEGALFTEATSYIPLCVPSRATVCACAGIARPLN